MNEFNNSKLESTIEYSKKLEEEQKIAKFKHNLRKQGLLPILRDGYLYVYKIKSTEKSYELTKYYRETMYYIYNVIVENVETNSKKLITEFATHNANILYNNDFSNIYQRVISSNSKILKYTSN